MTSGSRSSEASLGEPLLNSGLVEDMLWWCGIPTTFCSYIASGCGWDLLTLMMINMTTMITVNAAPITTPNRGDIGRSPSEAEN